MCVCYSSMFLLFMVRQPPRTTVTNTLVPSTTLFGYVLLALGVGVGLLGVRLVLGPVLGVGVLGLLGVVLLDAHLGGVLGVVDVAVPLDVGADGRSEEHTSEFQSLMRISYAVIFLNKTTYRHLTITDTHSYSLTQ